MTKKPPRQEFKGPIEAGEWPSQLTAKVVTPGPDPRIHGYSVEDDLAIHYSFGEVLLLSLTGEPQSPSTGRAFEIALAFLSPSPINEAPTHVASIARLMRTRTSAFVGASCVTLSEQAGSQISSFESFLTWLEDPRGDLPASARSTGDEDRPAVDRLRIALDRVGAATDFLRDDMSRTAALVGVLFNCGVNTIEKVQATMVVARLGSTIAEALNTTPRALREYPMNVPPIDYVEDAD